MSKHTTRRRVVLGIGALGATALAGCAGAGAGGGDGDGASMDGTSTEMMDTEAMDTESMDTEMGGMTDSEGGMTDSESGMADGTDSPTETTDSMGGMSATTFRVRVENVSTAETLQTSEGPKPCVLSPVAYAVHDEMFTLFAEGEAASDGLESLAEDGNPTRLVEEASMGAASAGAADVTEGGDEPGPAGPGESFAFDVEAHAGQRLSVASMFGQSNDLFYAFDPTGVPLFEDGDPRDVEATSSLALWDAGTEVNEEPGVGPNQAPRQSGPDTGQSEDGVVRPVADVDDGYDYPETDSVVRLTISPAQMSDG